MPLDMQKAMKLYLSAVKQNENSSALVALIRIGGI